MNSNKKNSFDREDRATLEDQDKLDKRAKAFMHWQSLVVKQGFNLPHWSCDGAIYHVSLRLADSVPLAVCEGWKHEREEIIAHAASVGRPLTDEEELQLQNLYSERIENYLDAGHGACHLRQPEIARMLISALLFFCGQRYALHAWCLMPNHIHIVFLPLPGWTPAKILRSFSSYTAHEANKILGLTGQFWQHEPYDHIIRSPREYAFQVRYVWENPDKAALRNWPWRDVNPLALELLETFHHD